MRSEQTKLYLEKLRKQCLQRGILMGGVWFTDVDGNCHKYTFNINRNDLNDIRRDIETLVKAGIDVCEVEAP